MAESLSLEVFAEISARVDAGQAKDAVLQRLGVRPEVFAAEQQYWLFEISRHVARGRFELERRYSELYVGFRMAADASQSPGEPEAARQAPAQQVDAAPPAAGTAAPGPQPVAPVRGLGFFAEGGQVAPHAEPPVPAVEAAVPHHALGGGALPGAYFAGDARPSAAGRGPTEPSSPHPRATSGATGQPPPEAPRGSFVGAQAMAPVTELPSSPAHGAASPGRFPVSPPQQAPPPQYSSAGARGPARRTDDTYVVGASTDVPEAAVALRLAVAGTSTRHTKRGFPEAPVAGVLPGRHQPTPKVAQRVVPRTSHHGAQGQALGGASARVQPGATLPIHQRELVRPAPAAPVQRAVREPSPAIAPPPSSRHGVTPQVHPQARAVSMPSAPPSPRPAAGVHAPTPVATPPSVLPDAAPHSPRPAAFFVSSAQPQAHAAAPTAGLAPTAASAPTLPRAEPLAGGPPPSRHGSELSVEQHAYLQAKLQLHPAQAEQICQEVGLTQAEQRQAFGDLGRRMGSDAQLRETFLTLYERYRTQIVSGT